MAFETPYCPGRGLFPFACVILLTTLIKDEVGGWGGLMGYWLSIDEGLNIFSESNNPVRLLHNILKPS
jgi:hypothetical protein